MKAALIWFGLVSLMTASAMGAESRREFFEPTIGIFVTNFEVREALNSIDTMGGHGTFRLSSAVVQDLSQFHKHVCLEYKNYGSDAVVILGSITGEVVHTPMISNQPEMGVRTSVQNVTAARGRQCK